MRIGKRGRTKSCASSQPAVRHGMKETYMPRLTAENKKQLQRLAARPDREIDLSDIPEIREIPSDAVIGKSYRPRKASVTIRIDADVLAWLRSSGAGHQTRGNTYLRSMMRRRSKR
jgi:uncharacterized protein (DUF4415 family)